MNSQWNNNDLANDLANDVVIAIDIDIDVDMPIPIDIPIVIAIVIAIVIDIGHETAMKGQWLINDLSMMGEAGGGRYINDPNTLPARRRPYISLI